VTVEAGTCEVKEAVHGCRNLVKLVKVGTGFRRVVQAVLRAGHMIWALVR